MRKITVNLTPDGVASVTSDKRLGFGGEHNAVTLCFAVDGEALAHFGNAEYFRVIVDGNYSDKLYLTENEVLYLVPQSVMNPPSVHCQLVGYIEADGEPSLIAKSSVAELTVDFSEAPVSEIGVGNDVFEKAMSLCTNAADKAKESCQNAFESANKSEQSSNAASQQAQSAKTSADVAEQHKDTAKAYSEQAKQCMEGVSGVANALKGTKTGAEVVIGDASPLSHNIKVTVSGAEGTGVSLAKGELIGTVAEIWDESITEHDWLNENELGSFTLFSHYVPVDNRTDLYVDIPAFAGESAGLLVTNGTVYRTFYACSYEGGEVYCYIDGTTINISYDGQTVISYGIEENSKIIGVGCDGESFFDFSLDLYACTLSNGVKLFKRGKNLFNSNEDIVNNYGISNVVVEGEKIVVTTSSPGKYTNAKILVPNVAVGASVTLSGEFVASGSNNGAVALVYFDVATQKTPKTIMTLVESGKSLSAVVPEEPSEDCVLAVVLYGNQDGTGESGATVTYTNVMLEPGTSATEYEPYVEPTECVVNADGTANVPSVYPTTKLYTDTEGVTITAEYNKDINKVLAEYNKDINKVLNDTETLSIHQKDIMRELAYLNDEDLQKDFNDSIQNGIGYSGIVGSVLETKSSIARAVAPIRSYDKDIFIIAKSGYEDVIYYVDENNVVEKRTYALNGLKIPKNQTFALMLYRTDETPMTDEEIKSALTVQNEEAKEEKRKLCGAFLDGKYINIAYSQISNPVSTVINTAEHYNLVGQTDGFDAIKGDIQITSDNELVMCHDNGFTFDDNGRITTFNKDDCTLIRNMTYADVIALEHARQFEGVYVHPTGIDSILRACKRYGKIPFITIRDEKIDVIAPILIDKLRKYSLETCSIINSFTLASLATIRQYSDIVFLSQVIDLNNNQILSQRIIDKINEFGNVVISVFDSDASTVETTNAEMIEHAKSRGIRILGAIFNNSDTIEYVLNNGFSGGQAYIPFL